MLAVLRQPGVLPLFAASCFARLPIGALGLLLVLLAEDRTGSYAAGGLAAGAYILAVGVGAPLLARVVDRRGQAGVLRAGSVVNGLAILAIAALGDDLSTAATVALAAVAGAAQPPIGSCMRALWPELLPGDEGRHSAYALESVAIELVYVLGPVAIVGGLGTVSLELALAACGLFQLLGTWVFSLHRRSRRWRPAALPDGPRDLAGALRAPGVRVLLAVWLLCGVTVGAVEVVVAASVDGDERRSGLLLGLWGVGSMLAGVAVARLGAAPDGPQRLVLLVLGWAALHGITGFIASPVLLGVVLLLAGATIAPTFITANGMLDGLAPPGKLTEAFTWMTTGLGAGIAVGSAAAGALVESAAPGPAMLVLGAVTALGAVVVLRGQAALRPPATVPA